MVTNILTPNANREMYKIEINMISTKFNSNSTRKTLPKKIKTSTLNIGRISFFLLHSRAQIATIIKDKTITPII